MIVIGSQKLLSGNPKTQTDIQKLSSGSPKAKTDIQKPSSGSPKTPSGIQKCPSGQYLFFKCPILLVGAQKLYKKMK